MQLFNKDESQIINLQLGSSVVYGNSATGVAVIHVSSNDYTDQLDEMIDSGSIGYFCFGGDDVYKVEDYILSEFEGGTGWILTLEISTNK